MPTIAAFPQGRFTAAAGQARVPTAAVADVTVTPSAGAADDALQPYVATAPINASYAVMYAGAQDIAPADPTSAAYILAGIATQSGAAGATIMVRSRGAFAFSGWSWTPGAPVFVLPGGALTQAPPDPGVLHQVGAALDAVTLKIEPGEPIYL